ncbi:SGNH/GDSL hydrolase family protein [Streptomyces caatingaensis]|uniref:triacylglycerol lipase n=1 Tax=Streptomyces caatingaensis TaxID=1678637 RepID=A0A0K9X9B3_9ACTN|nr:SGNH/GDSL hydrolase family protein [Streptomyces caatingaensis]KNB49656.1 lipase [Streptomyces caatingaensis]
MNVHRLTGAASAVALTVLIALTGTGAAHSAPRPAAGPAYVALGDSYSSGVGAGSYQDDACKRSAKAYPALWAAAHGPASFAFTACSGARTGDVLGKQLAPLTASTGLVSLSVGGNDAGFSDTMTACVLDDDQACLDKIDTASAFVRTQLPARLDAVYDAVRSRAPRARVVVLGYPRFYRPAADDCVGLSETKRTAINEAADLLDSVIAGRAAAHGFSYGDVNTTFKGHELCSGSAWLHSVTFPVDESYHPTAGGQSGGYLPVFTSAATR